MRENRLLREEATRSRRPFVLTRAGAKQQISILKMRQSGLSDRSQRRQNYLGQCVLLEGRAEQHFQGYKLNT